ncbi:phage tail sheath C-terminal domain-containing protein [Mangrovicoccus algicola]|uniref:Phage tail sheath protein n=1 Tax=Mangrovicoccus algicola TaxID=2771008 RepID=A0A8J6Z5X9_9RHOB|nr:phage tail sheath C-terminal domain-containing protein [Mangrovicoccus algicola]MBE3638364.1 phage tail sheath protein [Mangrovicoccus algicola]
MTGLLTPGLYRQPVEPVRPVGALARGDVALLIGYARRGPAGRPVRIHSARQFEEIFGPPPEHGFLWHAVKGFFETGGAAAYVIRIAPRAARAARVLLADRPLSWEARAAFPWGLIDPARLTRADRAEAAVWVGLHAEQIRREGPFSPDPGQWGNALSLRVTRTARVRTQTHPGLRDEGVSLALASLAGVEPASVLEFSQQGEGGSRIARAQPVGIDAAQGTIRLAAPLAGFDPARAIRVASVEFDLEIRRDGQLEERLAARAPDPAHSASITGAVARSLCLAPSLRDADGTPLPPAAAALALAAVDWSDPDSWPAEGEAALAGGTDGLSEIGAADFLEVLGQAARIGDAAMIAAPDLVLPGAMPAAFDPAPDPGADCADLDPRPAGQVHGRVTGTTEAGEMVALAGVAVDASGPGGQTVTDAAGVFRLQGLPLAFVTLRLSLAGYEPLEYRLQPTAYAGSEPAEIVMTRIPLPRALSAQEVLRVQRQMADPAVTGPYKIAVLDAPSAGCLPDRILTWRTQLGDLPRAGLFAPWLDVAAPDGVIAVPPSGHVCGAFAAAERGGGIQRSGANLRLRHAEGATLAIGDAEQAGLNPAGVNAIRAFPGRGLRIHGTRSLGADPAARFLTTRRILDAVEKSLERALGWIVFEPNSLLTRAAAKQSASRFLDRLWRAGVLAGAAADAAYRVKCDQENNPAGGRAAGQLVIDIAIAPAEPYEFVLFRLGAAMEAVKVTESPS